MTSCQRHTVWRGTGIIYTYNQEKPYWDLKMDSSIMGGGGDRGAVLGGGVGQLYLMLTVDRLEKLMTLTS